MNYSRILLAETATHFVESGHHAVYPDLPRNGRKPAHPDDLSGFDPLISGSGPAGTWVVLPQVRSQQMQYLNSRLFWDKKVKIALLALATFIAMC
jgi:hypothetical protein